MSTWSYGRPKSRPGVELAPGTQVTLTSTPYGDVQDGTLVAPKPVTSNTYGVYTIKLADGSLYRTEGRLTPATKRRTDHA